MKKLAIVTTHPVQYNAPVFQRLAERGRIGLHVFYTWSQAGSEVFDPGFGRVRKWDIPLLQGYGHSFVCNTAKKPGSHHFRGIINPALIKSIERFNPDAILVIGWAFQSHLNCIRHFKGRRPVFFRGDSTLLNESGGVKTVLRRLFLRWVYRHIDLAFCVGQNNRDYFLKHGLREHQLRLAPHAIDNDRFGRHDTAHLPAIHAIRKELGLLETDFIVLFAGKLEPVKNPFLLLHLAARVKDPDIKFLVVGNGVLEKKLKATAATDSRLKFLAFQNQSQMPLIYRLASVFILPSRSETWGLGANEAMACGLPVILSSQVGGAVDLVRDNGIIFEPGDVEKVAAYIRELKTDPVKRAAAQAASLDHIQSFSFKEIVDAIENEMTKTNDKQDSPLHQNKNLCLTGRTH